MIKYGKTFKINGLLKLRMMSNQEISKTNKIKIQMKII